jgi:iron complex transport system substrate-binding protein
MIFRQLARWMVICALALVAASQAQATSYPLTVTDMAGQTITFTRAPEHLVLQDGRDILMLALLDREDPFRRLVAWNNLLKKTDNATWQILQNKWPHANQIIDMGFDDKGQVDLESVIAQKPDLMVAQLRARGALQQAGVIDKLTALHIPVIYLDDNIDPLKNTAASVELLGKVLDKEKNAQEYVEYYQQHLQGIQQVVAGISPHKKVFIEPLAGKNDSCCFTHGDAGWGRLISAVGAVNLGSGLLPGESGFVSLEKVISMQPDVYLISGSARSGNAGQSQMMPFGYHAQPKLVLEQANKLFARQGVQSIPAVQQGHVAALYHLFYNHPYNIVGMEYLAKFIYPQQFASLQPAESYHQIIQRFTHIPDEDFIFGWSAGH